MYPKHLDEEDIEARPHYPASDNSEYLGAGMKGTHKNLIRKTFALFACEMSIVVSMVYWSIYSESGKAFFDGTWYSIVLLVLAILLIIGVGIFAAAKRDEA
mmetsp:Transcript_22681/g.19698  ORF Transcript_22681/g.19698 Transcript_22681/m.19698 type:complete len:101 (+) Transcript_22681:71-373(+)